MQLEIDGIGQQKYQLSDWKREHKVFAHHAPHMEESTWSSWHGIDCPSEFLGRYGDSAFGFGMTERECLDDLLEKWPDIPRPFWW